VLTQGGKGSDGVSGQPLRVAEVEGRLQVEPELRIHTEEMPQPQGRVAGDGSPAIQVAPAQRSARAFCRASTHRPADDRPARSFRTLFEERASFVTPGLTWLVLPS